ncbi:MAG: hypothetical protein RBT11_09935 [Desulfobacterales bacterium]|jgi:predicted nucleic acid-binding protein|nr:hypothetical protein [Desulfobacterales bacterium]
MPEIQQVIADTSVLIAFEKLKLLNLLCHVYDQILLPSAVHHEYSSDSKPCFTMAEAPQGVSKLLENEIGLGRGESEAIALAFTSDVPVLIDDLKGRKAARTLGCRISGTIGVLVKMERWGFGKNGTPKADFKCL